ncbi:hypothetical protein HQ36_05445 [Porphyromonas gingivicanis]|uniref:Uncharacterized protein n=1 Tax=Porphyromonas gingivicanis TaxID=266762 RepID=A0A0A2G5K9_9PORP|nr:hypothetical protein HQ36_05445 [Porphyromonas gingivicanis]
MYTPDEQKFEAPQEEGLFVHLNYSQYICNHGYGYGGYKKKRAMKFYDRTNELAEKAAHLKQKLLPKYQIEQRCLSLDDM